MTADSPVRLVCQTGQRLARALAELEVELPSEREVRRGLADLRRTIEFADGESGVRFLEPKGEAGESPSVFGSAAIGHQEPAGEEEREVRGPAPAAHSWARLGVAALAGAAAAFGFFVLLFAHPEAPFGVRPETDAFVSGPRALPEGPVRQANQIEKLALEPGSANRPKRSRAAPSESASGAARSHGEPRAVAGVVSADPAANEARATSEEQAVPEQRASAEQIASVDPMERRYALAEETAPAETITREFPAGPSDEAALGHININSFPIAGVVLDGRPLGGTPVTRVPVKAGEHTVVFVHPELGRKLQVVRVHPGGTVLAAVRFR